MGIKAFVAMCQGCVINEALDGYKQLSSGESCFR